MAVHTGSGGVRTITMDNNNHHNNNDEDDDVLKLAEEAAVLHPLFVQWRRQLEAGIVGDADYVGGT